MESVFEKYDTEPERAYEVGSNGASIWIAKKGGGTVGKSYHGDWLAQFRATDGTILHQDEYLCSGLPKSHDEMARVYADFLRVRKDIPTEMNEDLTIFAMGEWDE